MGKRGGGEKERDKRGSLCIWVWSLEELCGFKKRKEREKKDSKRVTRRRKRWSGSRSDSSTPPEGDLRA
jgi:hypothetical protein